MVLKMYSSSVMAMNRQIKRIRVSRLVWILFCAFVVGSFGCDLGTYSNRFKTRNEPVKAKPAKDAEESEEAVEPVESEDSQ